MTVKILKYDYIVLCLFEKVDDFINVHIEKRRGRRACCNGTFQYVNFINTYTPIKYPVRCNFFSAKNKAVKRNIPALPNLASTGNSSRN